MEKSFSGEVLLCVQLVCNVANLSQRDLKIKRGEALGQLIIRKAESVDICVVSESQYETDIKAQNYERVFGNDGGIGSTG